MSMDTIETRSVGELQRVHVRERQCGSPQIQIVALGLCRNVETAPVLALTRRKSPKILTP